MTDPPRYFNSKMGEIVRAITIESKHSWQEIKSLTNCSEKELNYNLFRLFNEGAITKERGQYFVTPSLEAEWLNYYQKQYVPIKSKVTIVPTNKNGKNTPQIGNKVSKIIIVSLLLLGIGALIILSTSNNSKLSPASSSTITSSRTTNIGLISTCTKVIDGDTFELSSGKVVRLADINAPDSNEQGYASSSSALSSWILGKQVYLDVDDVYVTDSYGRYVCVVYIATGSGYTNVNQALLTGGYAKLSDYSNEFDPNSWSTSSVINASQATQDSSTSTSSGGSTSSTSGPYWGSKNSDIYHKPSCYWAKQISSSNLIIFSSRSAAETAGYRACKVCNP